MKRLALIIALLAIFSNPIWAATEKLTGKEWLKISEQRKLYYIFGKREEFQEKGVVFGHSAEDYIDFLNKKIRQNSSLESENVDNVFKNVVRENEAGATEALPN